MESPPHAVFHDKYQSYKYEKIQQGNMLGGASNKEEENLWFIHYLKSMETVENVAGNQLIRNI